MDPLITVMADDGPASDVKVIRLLIDVNQENFKRVPKDFFLGEIKTFRCNFNRRPASLEHTNLQGKLLMRRQEGV